MRLTKICKTRIKNCPKNFQTIHLASWKSMKLTTSLMIIKLMKALALKSHNYLHSHSWLNATARVAVKISKEKLLITNRLRSQACWTMIRIHLGKRKYHKRRLLGALVAKCVSHCWKNCQSHELVVLHKRKALVKYSCLSCLKSRLLPKEQITQFKHSIRIIIKWVSRIYPVIPTIIVKLIQTSLTPQLQRILFDQNL